MTFGESIEIEADPASLFRLSQDYGRRLEWDPFLRSASLVGEAREAGLGVRALCVSRGGWAMVTEYVSFNPPRATAVTMTRGPRFLRSFAGSWRFEEVAPGRTRVGFRYSLRARPWWLSWLLTRILARAFARDTRDRLRALKEAVESRGLLAGAPGGRAPHRAGIGPPSRPRYDGRHPRPGEVPGVLSEGPTWRSPSIPLASDDPSGREAAGTSRRSRGNSKVRNPLPFQPPREGARRTPSPWSSRRR